MTACQCDARECGSWVVTACSPAAEAGPPRSSSNEWLCGAADAAQTPAISAAPKSLWVNASFRTHPRVWEGASEVNLGSRVRAGVGRAQVTAKWTFYTFSGWQRTGQDAQSVVQNPGLRDPAYPADDYSLPNGSPRSGIRRV